MTIVKETSAGCLKTADKRR